MSKRAILLFFIVGVVYAASSSVSSAWAVGASNISVTCDRWPKASSLEAFARDAVRITGAQTSEEKALAIFRFIRMWTSATDGHVPREPALGDNYIDDPLKVLNVYGAHHCDGLSRIMEVAWRALGFRAEKLYRSGHTQANIFYEDEDGTFRGHLFDVSRGWYVYDRSGKHIATPDEIASDFSLVLMPSKGPIPSRPHYRGMWNWVHAPHVEWPTYSPGLSLRKGEKLILYWSNFNSPYQDNFRKKGKKDFEHGPYSVNYGNAVLVYRPELGTDSWHNGASHVSSHMIQGHDGTEQVLIHPGSTDKTAEVVWTIKSPYIIADAWIDAQIFRKRRQDKLTLAISTDGGSTWEETWQAKELGDIKLRQMSICKRFDLYNPPSCIPVTPFGRYEYKIKIKMRADQEPEGVGIRDIQFTTVLQHNIFALPQLWPGKNIITVNGTLDNETSLLVTYLWSDQMGKSQKNVASVEDTPFEYPIFTAGRTWKDVQCRSLTIEATANRKVGNEVVIREKRLKSASNLSVLQAFGTDEIVGRKKTSPLKTAREYIELLGDPRSRVEALKGLMVLRDPASFERVKDIAFQSIRFPDKDLAVQALHLIDPERSVPVYLSILKMDPRVCWKEDPNNRFVKLEHWYNISALIGHIMAQNAETQAVPHLCMVLRNVVYNDDAWWEPHASIIRSLGRLGEASAASVIRPFLHRNIDAVAQAVWALGEIGDRKSLSKIKELFHQSNYPVIKTNGAIALGKLGDRDIVPNLYKVLQHRDENYRAAGAEALGYVGNKKSVFHLKKMVQQEPFPWVRDKALASLKMLGISAKEVE